ncbi:MAG: flavin reductase family protein [Acetivibrio ethanolgignens]
MEKELWKPGHMLYPLPAIMVSCQEKGKKPNIITVAWTGTVCTNPPMVYVSIRPERYSYDIIKKSGEFVVNLTTRELARATDFCGVRSGREVDKFAEMRLTPSESETVLAPGILESPVNIECRVREIQELGSHHMFLAEVTGVRVDKQYMDEKGRFDLSLANPLIYSHGEYFDAGERLGKFGYSVQKPKKERKRREK